MSIENWPELSIFQIKREMTQDLIWDEVGEIWYEFNPQKCEKLKHRILECTEKNEK